MKFIKLKKDAKLIPARNRVLLFSGEGQLCLEGERIIPLVGRIAPLISRFSSEAEIIERFLPSEKDDARRVLDLLCQRGFVIEKEDGMETTAKSAPYVSAPNITFIGHATLLIEAHGLRILTDPWLFPHDRHISHAPYPITFEDLPPIDLICISHMHGDHLNLPTLLRLEKGIPVVVPRIEKPGEHNRSLDRMLGGLGFERIICLERWESFKLQGVSVTRTPCHSAWGITEQATWLIESDDINIFCGGDMLEDEEFMKHLGDNYRVDIAFLPISGYSTHVGQSFLKDIMPAETHDRVIRDVMGVKEAVQSTHWIRPKFAVGYANGGAYWYKHPECSITGGNVDDFIRQLEAEGSVAKGIDMRPGDIWEHKSERLFRG